MNDVLNECLSLLEYLRDNVLTNHESRGTIDRLVAKAKVIDSQPDPVLAEVPVETPTDRRSEPRDPFESEQHLAEERGFVTPVS